MNGPMGEGGVVVHCPKCGAAIVMHPTASKIVVYDDSLTITFNSERLRHVCKR